jgi:hypothetical protein
MNEDFAGTRGENASSLPDLERLPAETPAQYY